MRKYINYKIKISEIFKVNYLLAGLYLIQFLLIIFIAKSYLLSTSTSYITNDQLLSKASGANITSPATNNLFDVNIKLLMVIMILFTALVYFWLATKYRYQYEKLLKHRTNPIRWLQTGISSGLILVIVGLLGGIYDIATLGVIFIMPIVTSYILMLREKSLVESETSGLAYSGLSLITAIIPLAIIGWYILSALLYGVQGISAYYYFLFATVILFYIAIYLNQFLLNKKYESWKKYIYGEQIYLLLEAIIKTAIIWQIYAGVLH